MQLKLIIVFIAIISLVACSRYYAMSDDIIIKLDQWTLENEYGKIDDTLKYVKSEHRYYSDIQAKKNDIKQKKTAYISEVLDKSHKMKAEGRYAESINVLQDAINKIPDQTDLVVQRDKYIQDRDARIVQLRKDMLLRRARSLVQYEPIYKELEIIIPQDASAKTDIKKYYDERNEISGHLFECGKYALTQKDNVLAEECLSLSNTLVNTAEKQAMLDKTRVSIKQVEEKNKIDQLFAAYQKAYDGGELVVAGSKIDELINLKPDNQQARALKDQLVNEIKSRVIKGLEEAKNLYTQGKINEVIDICAALQQIDPKNEEIIVLLNRASKVSKNIEKLSKEKKKNK